MVKMSGFLKIKRIIPVLLVVFGVLVLSSTASEALGPGISPDIFTMQKNVADAMRVRDGAYGMQINKRSDSVLGLSCFSMSMGLTAALGIVFSDRVPMSFTLPSIAFNLPRLSASFTCSFTPSLSITPTITFTPPSLDLTRGFGLTLSKSMNAVISNSLSGMLGNFSSTITAGLGALANTFILGAIQSILNVTLPPLLALLPSAPPNSIFGMIMGVVSSCLSIQDAINALMKLIASLLFPPSSCNIIADIWKGAAAITSITDTGVEQGTAYIDRAVLLKNTVTGMGSSFMTELGTATDTATLTKTSNDLLLKLSTPGGTPSWKPPVFFGVNTPTANIISNM